MRELSGISNVLNWRMFVVQICRTSILKSAVLLLGYDASLTLFSLSLLRQVCPFEK